MKIYTRRGDSGETALFGGERVRKNSPRIEACGNIDELNSVIGFILTEPLSEPAGKLLPEIQRQLFVLGSDLSTPLTVKERIDRIGDSEIQQLETSIDTLEEELPPLKHFILPGGSRTGALLHLARTVCRRAERAAVSCAAAEAINEKTIIWLNRFSDLLFVLARFENQHNNQPENEWKPLG